MNIHSKNNNNNCNYLTNLDVKNYPNDFVVDIKNKLDNNEKIIVRLFIQCDGTMTKIIQTIFTGSYMKLLKNVELIMSEISSEYIEDLEDQVYIFYNKKLDNLGNKNLQNDMSLDDFKNYKCDKKNENNNQKDGKKDISYIQREIIFYDNNKNEILTGISVWDVDKYNDIIKDNLNEPFGLILQKKHVEFYKNVTIMKDKNTNIIRRRIEFYCNNKPVCLLFELINIRTLSLKLNVCEKALDYFIRNECL